MSMAIPWPPPMQTLMSPSLWVLAFHLVELGNVDLVEFLPARSSALRTAGTGPMPMTVSPAG
jgi:hypothetical protein